MYTKPLEEFLTKKLSGKFRKVILNLLDAKRTVGLTISEAKADELAQQLYGAGEKKWGTNTDVFVNIMARHSPQDLTAVDLAYERLRQKRLTVAIKKEFSGDTRKLLMACVDPINYTCDRLMASMKGLGTDDRELVRLLAHRPKAEIEAIKAAFEVKFKKSLARWIKGDTSGYYRKALLSYIADISLAPVDKDADDDEDNEATGSGDGLGGEDDGDDDWEGNPDRPPPTFHDDYDDGASSSATPMRPPPAF